MNDELITRLRMWFGGRVPSAPELIARTIWGEARGDGRTGMIGVACCIMNRARHPRWWGHDAGEVCVQPWQFSCWNDGDPNQHKLISVGASDPDYLIAAEIAATAFGGKLADVTGGADSYYDRLMPSPPSWAAAATPTVTILRHKYFRVELAAPDGASPSVPR